MALYRVTLKNPVTGDEYELLPKSYNFTDKLNYESIATFVLGFEDIKKVTDIYQTDPLALFSSTYREIMIERTNRLGIYDIIFSGVITSFEVAPDGQGAKTITLKAVSWFGLLGKRRAGIPFRIFSATDAGTIAWTLINESQTSNNPYSSLGITQGAHPATKNRDRTYKFDNIKDSIIKLSNDNLADGFDFDIDSTKAFNVYYPLKGQNRFDIVFDNNTMATWKFKKPLMLGVANRIYVIGAGENSDVLYSQRDAANAYKTDWKLEEETLSESDVTELVTLQDKGDRYLALSQSPSIEFMAEHYDTVMLWDDYNLGDNIKVNVPEVGISSLSMRVIERTFTMDSTKSIGYIKVSLK